jgi:hypothetical protein
VKRWAAFAHRRGPPGSGSVARCSHPPGNRPAVARGRCPPSRPTPPPLRRVGPATVAIGGALQYERGVGGGADIDSPDSLHDPSRIHRHTRTPPLKRGGSFRPSLASARKRCSALPRGHRSLMASVHARGLQRERVAPLQSPSGARRIRCRCTSRSSRTASANREKSKEGRKSKRRADEVASTSVAITSSSSGETPRPATGRRPPPSSSSRSS